MPKFPSSNVPHHANSHSHSSLRAPVSKKSWFCLVLTAQDRHNPCVSATSQPSSPHWWGFMGFTNTSDAQIYPCQKLPHLHPLILGKNIGDSFTAQPETNPAVSPRNAADPDPSHRAQHPCEKRGHCYSPSHPLPTENSPQQSQGRN